TSEALNMEWRIKTLLPHCESGEAPYLTTRGWRRAQWLLTERSSRTICGVHFGAGTLVLPIRNTGAQLTGAQFIHPGGKKYLLPGSHLKDCFCPVHQASRNGRPEPWAPDSKPPEGIIITEGYATALAVSCFHHFPVVAALSAHNLKNVAISFRAQWPECHLILAGDNDCSQEKNTGLLNATAAAEVVKGCVVLPADTTLSDWDEFYRHYGESISRIVVQPAASCKSQVVSHDSIRPYSHHLPSAAQGLRRV
ncbi:toprim domain-containing protein, partial [Klebsiella pneumoniae]